MITLCYVAVKIVLIAFLRILKDTYFYLSAAHSVCAAYLSQQRQNRSLFDPILDRPAIVQPLQATAHTHAEIQPELLITGLALEMIALLAEEGEKKRLISALWNPIAPAVTESPDSSPASIHAGRLL